MLKGLLASLSFIPLAVVALLISLFVAESWPAWQKYGLSLITTADWDPVRESYGLLPALVGTLVISALALTLAAFLAISFVAVTYEFLPPRAAVVLGTAMDLVAAVPTVVFGLWGLFVLAPIMQTAQEILWRDLGWLSYNGVGPFAVEPRGGSTVLTASLLLAIMITPFAASVIREGYAAVPKEVVEAIHSITSRRWEIVRLKLAYIRQYVFSGLILALGRAFGETVAVAMVVGGNFVNVIRALTEPGINVSALIALQFPNAQAYAYMQPALFAAALLLAVIGFAINAAAVYFLFRR